MTDDDKILAKINHRERQILVHAYLYYKLNKNLIPDSGYYLTPEKYPRIVNRVKWLLKVNK